MSNLDACGIFDVRDGPKGPWDKVFVACTRAPKRWFHGSFEAGIPESIGVCDFHLFAVGRLIKDAREVGRDEAEIAEVMGV